MFRKKDVELFLDVPIIKAKAPPMTPLVAADLTSPISQHPFTRPDEEVITLKHWIYDLQKNTWIFNQKTIRYESLVTTLITQGIRRRKLIELGMDLHSSWVNLMLHLGLVVSQETNMQQKTTSKNLNKLFIATGMTDVLTDLDPDNVQAIFIQGEKYLLGYGVTQCYETAFKRYEAAAKHGLPEACNMTAVMYEFGIGHKKDLGSATKYYTMAANRNNSDAINHLARLHETGKGCEVSLKTAFALYKKAASLGQSDSLTNYGYMLENGQGCTENKQLAFEAYQIAADKGYARAQNALGTCFYKGSGVKRDFFQATIHYRKAADQAFPQAQNNLAICYEEGHGIAQDLARAKAYYKLAADKHHASATSNLGYMLILENEYLEAIEKFYLAKSLGSLDATFHLGHLYELGCHDVNGVVLQQDLDMALRFYAEAGKKGHTKALLRLASIKICGPERLVDIDFAIEALTTVAEGNLTAIKTIRSESTSKDTSDAQNMLGELCELGVQNGIDGEVDMVQALEWYRRALKNGNARAMFNLAAIYEKGKVVTQDMEKAIRLYVESEKKGNIEAKERLQELKDLGIRE